MFSRRPRFLSFPEICGDFFLLVQHSQRIQKTEKEFLHAGSERTESLPQPFLYGGNSPLFEASSQETALVEKLLEKMIRRDERIHRITRGERAVCLITEKGCGGTASNLFPNSPEELEILRSFEGKTLGEAAELLHHPLILCRSLGMAALGAGTPLPEMLNPEELWSIFSKREQEKPLPSWVTSPSFQNFERRQKPCIF